MSNSGAWIGGSSLGGYKGHFTRAGVCLTRSLDRPHRPSSLEKGGGSTAGCNTQRECTGCRATCRSAVSGCTEGEKGAPATPPPFLPTFAMLSPHHGLSLIHPPCWSIKEIAITAAAAPVLQHYAPLAGCPLGCPSTSYKEVHGGRGHQSWSVRLGAWDWTLCQKQTNICSLGLWGPGLRSWSITKHTVSQLCQD